MQSLANKICFNVSVTQKKSDNTSSKKQNIPDISKISDKPREVKSSGNEKKARGTGIASLFAGQSAKNKTEVDVKNNQKPGVKTSKQGAKNAGKGIATMFAKQTERNKKTGQAIEVKVSDFILSSDIGSYISILC